MFIIKLISSYTKAKGKKWTMISITKDKELMIETVGIQDNQQLTEKHYRLDFWENLNNYSIQELN